MASVGTIYGARPAARQITLPQGCGVLLMGLYLSLLQSEWVELIRSKISALIEKAGDFRSLRFTEDVETFKSCCCKQKGSRTITSTSFLKESLSFRTWDHSKSKLETNDSFRNRDKESEAMKVCPAEQTGNDTDLRLNQTKSLILSPRPTNELDAAAVKLQKVYKSYRTRRNLADCAVVAEELWWNALDFASLKHSSISFYNGGKPETAASRWARARTKAAKVGKGLSKNKRAQNLALQHWLEAIDPRHRYGHNLHLYYDVWFRSESNQPFFYWLDVGDGKELSLTMCPRSKLQQDCVRYLGPKERQAYEVIFEDGKLVYKQSGKSVDTTEGSKWIFVQSTTRALYVGQKKKGSFQHSSFLAGGATIAAGRLVVNEGILEAVWPYSGHYRPTEENFKEFLNFLQENEVDLIDVKRGPIGDDECSSLKRNGSMTDVDKVTEATGESTTLETGNMSDGEADEVQSRPTARSHEGNADNSDSSVSPGRRKWTTGAGPRIRCVRNYPTDLQFKALEQVNLSPRYPISPAGKCSPIPSPRPNPTMRLSPTLAGITLPDRAVFLSLPQHRPR